MQPSRPVPCARQLWPLRARAALELQVENVDHVGFVFDRVRSFGGPTRPADRAPPVLITMCESGMALLNLK